MVYLLLSILSSAAVIHLLKFSARRGAATFVVFAVNYLVAGLLGLLIAGLGEPGSGTPAVWALGVALGGLYVAGLTVFNRTIARSGTAVAASVSRLSVVIPVLASVVLFAEQITGRQLIAVGLAILALPLASPEPPWRSARLGGPGGARPAGSLREAGGPTAGPPAGLTGVVWPALLFLTVGASDAGLKVRVEALPESNAASFLAILFGTAFLVSLTVTLVSRARPNAVAIVIGMLLGGANFGTAYFLSAALERLSGFRVYTLNSVGVILVAALLGVVLWNERPRRHNYVFLAASVICIVLLG